MPNHPEEAIDVSTPSNALANGISKTVSDVKITRKRESVALKPLKLRLFDLRNLSPEMWEERRPCWYCGCSFRPKRRSDWQQHFCQEDHRKAFNKYGAMDYSKVVRSIREEMIQFLANQNKESLIEEIAKRVEIRLFDRLSKLEREGMKVAAKREVAAVMKGMEQCK